MDLVTKFNNLKTKIQAKEKELIALQTKLDTYQSEYDSYLLKLNSLGFSDIQSANQHLLNLEQSIQDDLKTLELNLSNPQTLTTPNPTVTQEPITPNILTTHITPPTTGVIDPNPPAQIFTDISDDLSSFM